MDVNKLAGLKGLTCSKYEYSFFMGSVGGRKTET